LFHSHSHIFKLSPSRYNFIYLIFYELSLLLIKAARVVCHFVFCHFYSMFCFFHSLLPAQHIPMFCHSHSLFCLSHAPSPQSSFSFPINANSNYRYTICMFMSTYMSAFRTPGDPQPSRPVNLSLRAPAQMGWRKMEHKGKRGLYYLAPGVLVVGVTSVARERE
jgi:hypothetical protein